MPPRSFTMDRQHQVIYIGDEVLHAFARIAGSNMRRYTGVMDENS